MSSSLAVHLSALNLLIRLGNDKQHAHTDTHTRAHIIVLTCI